MVRAPGLPPRPPRSGGPKRRAPAGGAWPRARAPDRRRAVVGGRGSAPRLGSWLDRGLASRSDHPFRQVIRRRELVGLTPRPGRSGGRPEVLSRLAEPRGPVQKKPEKK